MFQRVGRRLALLNALVVIAVIAVSGAVTYFALRASLIREVDNALRERLRATSVQQAFSTTPTPATSSDGHNEDEEDGDSDEREHDEEIVESGDTIVFAVDRDGRIIGNPRGVDLPGVPVEQGVLAALSGENDTRTVSLPEAGSMRVMTMPVYDNDQIVGAAQALRSLREHDAELALVRWMTLLGVGLGVVVALPAGLYLAGRAMQPIGATFERQRAFVADASHELRTPLTLIRANADYALLDEAKRVGDVAPELRAVLAEVDRTDRLVDDLLTLARADAGRLELQRDIADIARLTREAAESMRPLCATQGVALTITTTGEQFAWVDTDRLRQVIRNLLDNALKHTSPGGSVAVDVARQDTQVTVTVRDTGSGIPREELEHVFDRFYRADRSRSRATGGVGLGLPIAKAIVEAHGGWIVVSSVPEQGTTVAVTLPAHVAPP